MGEPREIRDFGAGQREPTGEPVRFRLGEIEFACVDPVPIGMSIVMAGALRSSELEQLNVYARGIKKIIVPEQHDEWDEVLLGVSDREVLTEILKHIVSESTGRPTEAPDDSPESSSSDGPSSTGASTSPESPAD